MVDAMTAVPEIPMATRRAINELVEKGCSVRVHPDGTVEITPVNVQLPKKASTLNLVDFRK